MQIHIEQGSICWFTEGVFSDPSPQLFNSNWWQERGLVVGTAIGRGVTWFVKGEDQHFVLRHYYRGGLMSKLSRDLFWFRSIESSRAMAEFSLLTTLCALNLPVPRPIGARLVRQGPFYRADILIARIEGAKDVVSILKQAAIASDTWHKIGQTIKQLHDAGVDHADLNSHNLLLDKTGKVWIIDFDKGAIRQPGGWQKANLERLLRSLNKEAKLHTCFHFVPDNWDDLLLGYYGDKK